MSAGEPYKGPLPKTRRMIEDMQAKGFIRLPNAWVAQGVDDVLVNVMSQLRSQAIGPVDEVVTDPLGEWDDRT